MQRKGRKLSDLTEKELLRLGLKKGRIRTKGLPPPSYAIAPFKDALAKAEMDDLLWALNHLVHTKSKHQTWRAERIRRIDKRLRELMAAQE